MTTAPMPRAMTADELLGMPEDGHRYELVRGELVSMSPAAVLSSVVSGNVYLQVGGFVREHALGLCGTAEGGFTLTRGPDTVRAPDVWFIRRDRVPETGIPSGFWPGAPDLAIEVLSPTDRVVNVLRKAYEYLVAGARLVWVLDPLGRSAAVFRPNAPALLGEDDVLDGGDVLPGFSFRLRDVLP